MPLIVNGNVNVWFVKQVNNSVENQVKKLIVDGVEVWNRFDMEEKVEITASIEVEGSNQVERIRINNITPYPITITKISGSRLNNGNKNISITGGQNKYISSSTRLMLGGGYTVEVTYTCDGNTHTKSAYIPF